MPNKSIPSIGDSNWGTPLNAHLAQLQNPTTGGINTFEQFSSRPTNLTVDDTGKTYLYTQTGNLHQWTGTTWKVLNESVINVKDYGAIGDGVVDDFSVIKACLELEGETVLFSKGLFKITGEITTFKNLIFQKGAALKAVGKGTRIRLEGNIDAGLYKIFEQEAISSDLGISLNTYPSFIVVRRGEIYPEWWGTRPLQGGETNYNDYVATPTFNPNQIKLSADNKNIKKTNDFLLGDTVVLLGAGAFKTAIPSNVTSTSTGSKTVNIKIAYCYEDWGISKASSGVSINYNTVDDSNPLKVSWANPNDPDVTGYIIYANGAAVQFAHNLGSVTTTVDITNLTETNIGGTGISIWWHVWTAPGNSSYDGRFPLPNGFPGWVSAKITNVDYNNSIITIDQPVIQSRIFQILLDSSVGFHGCATSIKFYTQANSLFGLWNLKPPTINVTPGQYFTREIVLNGFCNIKSPGQKSYGVTTAFTPLGIGKSVFYFDGNGDIGAGGWSLENLMFLMPFFNGGLDGTAFIRTAVGASAYIRSCRATGDGIFFQPLSGGDFEIYDCAFDSFVGITCFLKNVQPGDIRISRNYNFDGGPLFVFLNDDPGSILSTLRISENYIHGRRGESRVSGHRFCPTEMGSIHIDTKNNLDDGNYHIVNNNFDKFKGKFYPIFVKGFAKYVNISNNHYFSGNEVAFVNRLDSSVKLLTSGNTEWQPDGTGSVSGNSRVGIGTSNPSDLLQVMKEGNFTTATDLMRLGGSGNGQACLTAGVLASNNSAPYLQGIYGNGVGFGNIILNPNGGSIGIGTKTPKSKLSVVGLVEFTDNTAALVGGLTVGDFYRTGDILKVVH
jgi:hypothetical protein